MSPFEKLKTFLDMMPFMLNVGGDRHRVNLTRLIEAGIIAVVTAVIVNFASMTRVDVTLVFLQKSIDKLDSRIERLEESIFKHEGQTPTHNLGHSEDRP